MCEFVIKIGSLFTKIIDGDPSVGESSGGLVGVEIFSVRKVIGARAKVPRKLLVPQSTEESPMTNSAGAKGTWEEKGAVEGGGGSWNWSKALDPTNVEDSITVDKRYTTEIQVLNLSVSEMLCSLLLAGNNMPITPNAKRKPVPILARNLLRPMSRWIRCHGKLDQNK